VAAPTSEKRFAEYCTPKCWRSSSCTECPGSFDAANELVDEAQRWHIVLRKTADGRDMITRLLGDPRRAVRLWAATHALAWRPEQAVAALNSVKRQQRD